MISDGREIAAVEYICFLIITETKQLSSDKQTSHNHITLIKDKQYCVMSLESGEITLSFNRFP